MKYSKKVLLISICITAIICIITTLAVLYGLQWLPKSSQFSFDTVGVFIGAFGSVGAIFIVWFTTRKQLTEQKQIQKQNVQQAFFDKRYSVYIQLLEVINNMISLKEDDIFRGFEVLGEIRDKIYFLFDESIHDYYLEIINNASILQSNLHEQTKQSYTESRNWFIRQIEKRELRSKFEKYLQLRGFEIEM